MKVAAVSADLLIKLALVAGGIGLAWYALGRLQTGLAAAAKGAGQAVTQVADAVIVGVSPSNPENIVNRGFTGLGDLIVSDTGPGRNANGSWTFGGFVYDVLHKDPLQVTSAPKLPASLTLEPDYYDVPTLGFGA